MGASLLAKASFQPTKILSWNGLRLRLAIPNPMLSDRSKEWLRQRANILALQQPGIRFQFQQILQLLGIAVQRNRLQMLVRLQQVMQRHAVAAQRLHRRRATRHEHRVKNHRRHAFHRSIHWQHFAVSGLHRR